EVIADAHTLIIRQRHRAVLASGGQALADVIDPGREGDRALVPGGQEADRAGAETAAQIVVRCEQLPRRWAAANDVEFDGWATLKKPPLKEGLGGAVHPVGLQPGLDIFVTGQRDELLAA